MWGYKNIFIRGHSKYLNRPRKIFCRNKNIFEKKSGVEIGGPSFVFSKEGPIPFYKIIKRLDNINFNEKTYWANIDEGENFLFDQNKQKGKQVIADATDLSIIPDGFYDFALSSHVIEHIANPIKALIEWRRIIKTNGYLAIIAPDMNYTYDRNRPLTTLIHIINDYKNHTEENDDSHFEEVMNMHDLSKDGTVCSNEEHIKRTTDNINTRIVHHHTFNMALLVELLKYCKFKIIETEFVKPYHLVVITEKV